MMHVTYYIEKQYGIERRYPVSPWAKRFCWIAGTKTLGNDLIEKISSISSVRIRRVMDDSV